MFAMPLDTSQGRINKPNPLAGSTLAKRMEQRRESVVIDFMHQRQQEANLAFGKAFPGKPVEVVARQVGDQPALVFAERHFAFQQKRQVVGAQLSRLRV